jgi:hypothetical protein
VNKALGMLIHEPEYDDEWDGDEDRQPW